jgi:long-chain acyl-CoA synthetase
MHPTIHAQSAPDKPAIIMGGSGQIITYKQLDDRSNQFAQFARSHGLQIGDTIAICMENCAEYFDVVWGAQRSGLIYVAMSNRMTADEMNYILSDSGAKMIIASPALGPLLHEIGAGLARYLAGPAGQSEFSGWQSLTNAMAQQPETAIADERAGADMLYSSGTTGRPKGVRLPLPEDPGLNVGNVLVNLAVGAFGFTPGCVYLSPAPLYHAAPLRWCMTVHKLGGTVIVMEKFDPEKALSLIELYKVEFSQWVPTHFVRMLKLPPETRAKYDVSSLRCAIHAAAPCPVPIKEQMIDWWGPVLMEYYAGTEGNGFTFISSQDWLTHKGSVGRAIMGVIRICDDEGNALPARQEGAIFFEGGNPFSYHNDPEKTAQAANKHGWTSLGDVGWADEDGFLYLTDRKSFMIISGGVNIYPQEIENHLINHPAVADVAVIGGPHDEMGEEVIAVIQPADMSVAGDALRDELQAFAREKLSGVKIPRRIDFRAELPRHDTGKLYKRLLRNEYWEAKDMEIPA